MTSKQQASKFITWRNQKISILVKHLPEPDDVIQTATKQLLKLRTEEAKIRWGLNGREII